MTDDPEDRDEDLDERMRALRAATPGLTPEQRERIVRQHAELERRPPPQSRPIDDELTHADAATRRRLAGAYFACEVELDDTVSLTHGTLELWRVANVSPSHVVAFFVSPLGHSFRVNASPEALERAFREGQVDLASPPMVADVLWCGPRKRCLALDEGDVPKAHLATDWRPRLGEDGTWVGHTNDYDTGLWERVTITRDYVITFEVVGDGRILRML